MTTKAKDGRDGFDRRLIEFGYAPGGYTGKCIHCDQATDSVDKRATSCKQCAEKRLEESHLQGPKDGRETLQEREPGPKEYQPAHTFWERFWFFILSGGHKL